MRNIFHRSFLVFITSVIMAIFLAPQVFAQSELYGEVLVFEEDDFINKKSKRVYRIKTNQSQHKLRFLSKELLQNKMLLTGDKIKIKGNMKKDFFEVEKIEIINLNDSQAQSENMFSTTADTQRKAITVLVDFIDAGASDGYTTDQVANIMYYNDKSVTGVFEASSYNQLGFVDDTDGDNNADVFGPVSINHKVADSCDYTSWGVAADNELTNLGIDLSQYQHRVYVLPHHTRLPNCGWVGVANVGCGTYCRVWIAQPADGMVYAHELGHNLNLLHASVDSNNDGISDSEYGDLSGIMGNNSSWNTSNAPHRDQLNWFDAHPNSIVDITESGSYNIAALENTPDGNNQVIRLFKKDSGDYYYLSYRQAIGNYPVSFQYADKISIHRYLGSGRATTYLITTLTENDSFEDSNNAISIRAVSTGNALATLDIGFECSHFPPTIMISPSEQFAQSGASKTYSVSIENLDSAFCGASNFIVSKNVSSGLIADTTEEVISISPGQQHNFNWDVGSQSNLIQSTYGMSISVVGSNSIAEHTSQVSNAALTIDNTAPSIPSGITASTIRKKQIRLSWNASSDNISTINSYDVFRNNLFYTTVATTSFVDSATKGQSQIDYQVRAVDVAGNVSALSEVTTVIVSTKGNGGGKGRNK